MQVTLNNNMLTSMGVHDSLIEKGTTLERVQGAVAKAFGLTADEITRANQAGQNFNLKRYKYHLLQQKAIKTSSIFKSKMRCLKYGMSGRGR
jgi:hypothetical protein